MTPIASLHEDLTRDEVVARGSDRSFGFVFAVVFAVIALAGWWRTHHLRTWAIGLSLLFLGLALLAPVVLAPLNAIWARFGLLLHRVTSPLILGLMYGVGRRPGDRPGHRQ